MSKRKIFVLLFFAFTYFLFVGKVGATSGTYVLDKSWLWNINGNQRYSLGGQFVNWGRSHLIFSVKTNGPSSIKQVTFTGSNQVCLPVSSSQYYEDSTVNVSLQFFNCEVELGSGGLGDVVFDFDKGDTSWPGTSNTYFETSYYIFAMTELDYTSLLNSINNNTSNINSNLNTIYAQLYDIDLIMRNWHFSGDTLFSNQNTMISLLQSLISSNSTLHNDLQQSNTNTSDIANNTEETNDIISSDDVSGAEDSADDLVNNSSFQDDTGLNAIIGLPLSFINTLGTSCTPIQLTIPYMNYQFDLPCLQAIINRHMPALVVIIKIVVNGLIIYWILLDIFKIVKDAKNPDDDRIEVLDL